MKTFTLFILSLLCISGLATTAPVVSVMAEEEVYSFTAPNNGSGPMWSYGCTSIVRLKDEVFVTEVETGKDVPRLCNTRWRLRKRDGGAWTVVAEAEGYRQREPVSLGTLSNDSVYLYVNDSIMPPGTEYGPCNPHLLRYVAGDVLPPPQTIQPVWDRETYFTDHSYRGYAADRAGKRLIMLNIDAKKSTQHWSWLSGDGRTHGNGHITFPIRSCYPQVALAGNTAHVLAVGDIVEPVEEWRKLKFERTQRKWDYVFRRLFYVHAPDLKGAGFGEPLEIANVDATAGYIGNQDLWIAPDGAAHILYTQRNVQHAWMRDEFFPEESILNSLHLAVVRDGAVVRRVVLIAGNDQAQPGHARFQETAQGALYALVHMSGAESGNVLLPVPSDDASPSPIPVPLTAPFGSFMLANTRAGNAPSNTIDVFGHTTSGTTLNYAQLKIAE